MKIAVPYDNGMVFGHFGRTAAFKIYEVENGKVVNQTVISTGEAGHSALATLLSALDVSVLLCGGIGGGAQMALKNAGIQFFGGVQGLADRAVEAYLTATLSYDPNFKCGHHGAHHENGHSCSEHSCSTDHHCGGCHH